MTTRIEAIANPKNWKLNLTKMAKETKSSIGAIAHYVKKKQEQGIIKLEINILSELDALNQRGKKNGNRKKK